VARAFIRLWWFLFGDFAFALTHVPFILPNWWLLVLVLGPASLRVLVFILAFGLFLVRVGFLLALPLLFLAAWCFFG